MVLEALGVRVDDELVIISRRLSGMPIGVSTHPQSNHLFVAVAVAVEVAVVASSASSSTGPSQSSVSLQVCGVGVD